MKSLFDKEMEESRAEADLTLGIGSPPRVDPGTPAPPAVPLPQPASSSALTDNEPIAAPPKPQEPDSSAPALPDETNAAAKPSSDATKSQVAAPPPPAPNPAPNPAPPT